MSWGINSVFKFVDDGRITLREQLKLHKRGTEPKNWYPCHIADYGSVRKLVVCRWWYGRGDIYIGEQTIKNASCWHLKSLYELTKKELEENGIDGWPQHAIQHAQEMLGGT